MGFNKFFSQTFQLHKSHIVVCLFNQISPIRLHRMETKIKIFKYKYHLIPFPHDWTKEAGVIQYFIVAIPILKCQEIKIEFAKHLR